MTFPCHASVMLGALLSEIEHRFHSVKFRKTWLGKIQAKVIVSDNGAETAWVLPDGAGVQFPTRAPLEKLQEAAKALAQHIAQEIYRVQNGLASPPLEMANPPVSVDELAALQ